MTGNNGHKCKQTDLVTCNKPKEGPDGESVSFTVQCKVCGKAYEEIYSRNDGLWDPEKRKYVSD